MIGTTGDRRHVYAALLILDIQLHYENLFHEMFIPLPLFYPCHRSVEAGNRKHFLCARISG